MQPDVNTVNQILYASTILGSITTIPLFLLLFMYKKGYAPTKKIASFINKHALKFALAVAAAATAASLFYSEIIGYEPCKLCWYQRTLTYPQTIFFTLGLFNKDKRVFDYSLALSIPGAILALYNHYLQSGGNPQTPCSIETLANCIQKLTTEYGYISMPMMSFTAFLLLIIFSLFGKIQTSKNPAG